MGGQRKDTQLPEGAMKVFFSETQIAKRVKELGVELAGDYAGELPLLIAVLKGSVMFFSDLVRAMAIPVHMDFMAITSFETTGTKGGAVRIAKDLDLQVTDRHVILVEDIIDTGLTASYLVRTLLAREPASLKICTLLDRKVRRLVDLPLEYVGFEVPDSFLVGYGLDYRQAYRNRPSIFRVDEKALDGPGAGLS